MSSATPALKFWVSLVNVRVAGMTAAVCELMVQALPASAEPFAKPL